MAQRDSLVRERVCVLCDRLVDQSARAVDQDGQPMFRPMTPVACDAVDELLDLGVLRRASIDAPGWVQYDAARLRGRWMELSAKAAEMHDDGGSA